jgi:hypothetical protein
LKNVFILGAGASRQAGGPLMSDFLDRAEELMRSKKDGIVQAFVSFQDVFDSIAELQAVHAKSFLDLNNIEVLFGAIEMAQMICKLGERDQEKIIKLRESIITLILKTLEYSIGYPVQNQGINPPPPFDAFVRMLSGANTRRQKISPDIHEYCFITFNYDIALDFALYHSSMNFNYCLEDRVQTNYPLLKLHGSINWGVCEKCNKIIPFHISEAKPTTIDLFDNDHIYYDLSSKIHLKSCCETKLKGPPVLVPPTWNKTSYHGQLGNVWKRAAEELSRAENIFIIGYSLPETDSFFRYLFALGSESSTRIKRFWVFDPDSSGQVENRFRKLIGRGLENRFQYHSVIFKNAIPLITEALLQP